MGKMKQLWAEMREKEMYEMVSHNIPKEPVSLDIKCPNCFTNKLKFNSSTDIKCTGCAQEFVLVDANTVRFK
tara:strand:+ start:57 stop:272 length:216 start_codon:yes stop_codon:yes gene_type:complete